MCNPSGRVVSYVEWIEPYGSTSVPVICRMRLKDVLRVQIAKYDLYGSFPERAIEDFIIVNWGRVVKDNF